MLSPPEANGLVPRPFRPNPSYDSGVPRPRIGLTTYREVAHWGVWDEPADLLPASYARSIELAGAVPLLLPSPLGEVDDAARIVLDALDGLLVAGGADVDPQSYGSARIAATGPARPERDAWETALITQALARELPVLGVCRGMQVLNTALGGSLIQHLPDLLGHDEHCPTVGVHGRHEVRFDPESHLRSVLGERALVATYHHQAVDRLGDGLTATGWTEDGTVEAIEVNGRDWALGVQWHPEVHDGARLFEAFAQACAQ